MSIKIIIIFILAIVFSCKTEVETHKIEIEDVYSVKKIDIKDNSSKKLFYYYSKDNYVNGVACFSISNNLLKLDFKVEDSLLRPIIMTDKYMAYSTHYLDTENGRRSYIFNNAIRKKVMEYKEYIPAFLKDDYCLISSYEEIEIINLTNHSGYKLPMGEYNYEVVDVLKDRGALITLNSGKQLINYSIKTGEKIWEVELPLDSGEIVSNSLSNDSLLFNITYNDRIFVHNINGEEIGILNFHENIYGVFEHQYKIHNNKIYYRYVSPLGPILSSINLETGDEQTLYSETPQVYGSFHIYNNHIYFLVYDKNVSVCKLNLNDKSYQFFDINIGADISRADVIGLDNMLIFDYREIGIKNTQQLCWLNLDNLDKKNIEIQL